MTRAALSVSPERRRVRTASRAHRRTTLYAHCRTSKTVDEYCTHVFRKSRRFTAWYSTSPTLTSTVPSTPALRRVSYDDNGAARIGVTRANTPVLTEVRTVVTRSGRSPIALSDSVQRSLRYALFAIPYFDFWPTATDRDRQTNPTIVSCFL